MQDFSPQLQLAPAAGQPLSQRCLGTVCPRGRAGPSRRVSVEPQTQPCILPRSDLRVVSQPKSICCPFMLSEGCLETAPGAATGQGKQIITAKEQAATGSPDVTPGLPLRLTVPGGGAAVPHPALDSIPTCYSERTALFKPLQTPALPTRARQAPRGGNAGGASLGPHIPLCQREGGQPVEHLPLTLPGKLGRRGCSL